MMIFDHGDAVRRLFDRDRDEVRIEAPREVGQDACAIEKYARENLDVQVRLEPKGTWHKKAIGGLDTACGEAIENYFARKETYAGPLCPTCFTPHELKLAELAAIVEYPTSPDAPKKR